MIFGALSHLACICVMHCSILKHPQTNVVPNACNFGKRCHGLPMKKNGVFARAVRLVKRGSINTVVIKDVRTVAVYIKIAYFPIFRK